MSIRKKIVKKVALVMVVVMTLGIIPILDNTTSQATETINGSEVVKTSTITIDGVERTLIVLENGEIYLKVGEEEPMYILDFDVLEIKFDKYGTLWFIDPYNGIYWWNYDLENHELSVFNIIPRQTEDGSTTYVDDAESLVLDDQGLVIGYKTISGETYPILTLDEMKEYLGISDDPTPPPATPTPNAPTPTPTAPTATPVPTATPTPTNTEKPAVTPEPTVSPQPTSAPKVSIKKSSGYTCLSVGNKVVSKYKLKKGVLTWKGTKKSQKVKQVKQAGFIKKSKNLVYITKKGKAYTISQKGKKKTIVKKDAKKLIFKNGFVTKIKKKSGYLDVVNK